MNPKIDAEIKKATKKMNATTEMESHNYYRGKIAGLKLAIRLEPQVKPANKAKWHFCKYCGAYVNGVDDECYKNPNKGEN